MSTLIETKPKKIKPTPGVRRRRHYRVVNSEKKPKTFIGRRIVTFTGIMILWIAIIVAVSTTALSFMSFSTINNAESKGRDEGYSQALNSMNGDNPTVDNVLRLNYDETTQLIADFSDGMIESSEDISYVNVNGWQTSHGNIGYAETMLTACHLKEDSDEELNVMLHTDDNTVAEPAWAVTMIHATGRECVNE